MKAARYVTASERAVEIAYGAHLYAIVMNLRGDQATSNCDSVQAWSDWGVQNDERAVAAAIAVQIKAFDMAQWL